jgi:hypothetical protein
VDDAVFYDLVAQPTILQTEWVGEQILLGNYTDAIQYLIDPRHQTTHVAKLTAHLVSWLIAVQARHHNEITSQLVAAIERNEP